MSTYKHSLAPIVIHAFPHPISALSFDPVSDALWVGSGNGYVSAHHSIQGLRGVCFKAGDLPVLKVVADENSVKAASAGGDGVGSWVKGGMNKWFYNSENSIMNFATSSTMTALSTSGSELLLINAMTGNLLRQTTIPSIATHLEFSHNILLSGSADGYLRAYDPRTGNIRNGGSESVVKAHYGGIQGLQTTGNFVFTIGMSLRQAHPFPDPLVKVYDLRNMRALPPISFAASPAFINVVPNRSATIAVTSNSGSISIVDASNFGGISNDFSQIEDLTSFVTAVAISPTGAYLACGDADGMIHLKSQVEGDEVVPLNGFEGRPVEWANPPEPLPELEWTDSTPLNTIGLPRYKTQLLSAWTPQFNSSKTVSFPPPQKIPVQVLNTMKMNDNVAYAPLPKELRGRRNMVALEKKKLGGRFRSGKSGTGDAVIVQVATDEHAHLVAIVKVPEAEGKEDEGASPWYIFNDFVVRNVPEQEALSFPGRWKEETEYRSDGTKKVLRPARLSLARVSCLRGNGPKEGVPFIDDHIHTSEVIVDYLTEFSGIKFGDLDPMRSPHTLTPLKVVYKKLRLLVDRGCIFIGHGLSKDFRIINIFVPPEQVIDTVDLYFIKARQRRLSLRFLSWYLFREVIQTETHDSIEDAHFALKLFKKYNEFEGEGIFDQKLEEIYKEGRQYVSIQNFKGVSDSHSEGIELQTSSSSWLIPGGSSSHTSNTNRNPKSTVKPAIFSLSKCI
ncbi:hypothetical protein HHX47_DHR1001266 [Lentinula edodes]|nr:hypothetical protein HHX47_DHR1001266 [Lentinula edodes]